MIQFYAPDIEATLTLPESDSGHCVRVLRLKEGDRIQAVDGRGNVFDCQITDAHPKHTRVEIVGRSHQGTARDYNVTLAVAPTKNIDRMEWLLEKAVEVGVDRVVLLECSRSERRKLRLERLEKIMVSAMKQSLKAVLPALEGPVRFNDFIKRDFDGEKFMCYCDKDTPRRVMTCMLKPSTDVCVLIGPEGDFSPEEARGAMDNGFAAVTLGDERLRTETAALFAVQSVHIINQLKECQTH